MRGEGGSKKCENHLTLYMDGPYWEKRAAPTIRTSKRDPDTSHKFLSCVSRGRWSLMRTHYLGSHKRLVSPLSLSLGAETNPNDTHPVKLLTIVLNRVQLV